jgi:crotonobetainyl-CoA:carnitine CoA-transferase CaiB-like acyl-CoA transferase
MNRHYQEGLPLSSYRALDVTDHMGLFCGQILAGLGAEVIRVDRPERGRMRFREGTVYFDCYNMGKKSITLNIEDQKGQEIFRKLAGNVDIVIESTPPGHMEGLGLGYAALREMNPKIIMTSITAFGQKGPYSRYKACDLTMMALGAFMVQDGDPDRSPLRIGVPQSYVLAGAHAAWGTMLALYHRHTSGEGQYVDVSARDCVVASNLVMAQRWEFASGISERHGQWVSRMGVRYRHIWPCRDGYVSFRIFPGAMGGPMVHRMVEWMDSKGMAGSLKGVEWKSVDMF